MSSSPFLSLFFFQGPAQGKLTDRPSFPRPRFDDKLDDVETEPPKVAEAFNDAISSEAGKNVRRGMVQAAKLTVDAGVVVAKGAAKGAVPVVSWVVKEGTKAMINKKKKK